MTFFKRLIAPFAALLALGAASAQAKAPAPVPATAHPALWEVTDPDTTIYLFGTIHLLPDNYQWRTAKFDEAVAGSQQLVVETIVDEKNPAKLMSAMASLGFANGLSPLAERLPEKKRPALEKAIKDSGFPPQALDKMKTWAAAFILLGNQYREMGLKGEDGVEITLRNNFEAQGKPVGELETNLQQLGFFDSLPESAQRQLLEGAVDNPETAIKEFRGMLAAWARGDVKEIGQTFNRDLSGSPALEDALMKRRNANWSKWIEQRMTQPGQIMIAVGAGHLAGPESVIALLERDGYHVRRVQ